MKKYISRAIAILTFVVIIVILSDKFDVIKKDFLEHKGYFLLIALAYLGGRVLDGLRLRVLVSRFEIDLKKLECIGLAFMMPFHNLIFPNAGILTNAVYLKSRYNLKYRHFISVGIIRFISTIVICGVIGIAASVIYMVRQKAFLLAGPITIYLAAMVIALLPFVIPVPNFLRQFKFFDKIEETVKGVKEVKSDLNLIGKMVGLQTGIILLFIFRYYIVFKALSLNAPFLSIAAIIPMTTLSNLITLMPSNLGIREAIVTSSSMLIGYSLGEGVLVASVDRAVILATLFIVGGWFFIKMKYTENLMGYADIKKVLSEQNNA